MLVNPDYKKLNLKQPYVWLATWFGFGLMRHAPGTWGSFAAISPALLIAQHYGAPGLALGIVIVSALGTWAAAQFEKASASHDNKMIVIDEVAGQWIAILPVIYLAGLNLMLIGLSFLLFRAFDILKPPPVSWADRKLPGAMGVMADDILAGILAALCIIGIWYAGIS